MKRKIIVGLTIILMLFSIIQLSVVSAATSQSNVNMIGEKSVLGDCIDYKDIDGNKYFVKSNNILKCNLKANTITTIHTIDTTISQFRNTVDGDNLYLYARIKDTNGKKAYQVFKYDLRNSEAISDFYVYPYDYIAAKKFIYSLEIDEDGNLYFTYDGDKAIEFDKNGKYIKKINNYPTTDDEDEDETIFVTNKYFYLKGDEYDFYRYNKSDEKVDGTYLLSISDDYDYIDYVVIDNDIYVLLLKNSEYYVAELIMKAVTTKTYTSNTASKHTKQDVINNYKKSLPKFNYKNSIYDKTPSYKNGKYVAGSLKTAVRTDTLNQLNFYRWLTGLNKVSINTKYLTRSQKGAVILAKLKTLTHFPRKPSDMSEAWYSEAFAGVCAGNDYSGNVSVGSRINNAPVGFILDVNNIMAGVGHRLSLLNPRSDKTSFGYFEGYTALSMYTTDSDLKNNDIWYSWPSAGYFPIEKMDARMQWSITLNKNVVPNDNFKMEITDGNNKKYIIKVSNIGYDDYYNSIFFDIPSGLRKYLSNNTKNFIAGRKVKVKITGLTDYDYNDVVISYNTEFIKATATSSNKKKISSLKISNVGNKKYTGKNITPNVTIKDGKKTLKKGTDYTLTYSNNKNTGKATVKITGKGKYTGSVTKTFYIVPKATTISSATSKNKKATVKWKKSTGSSGYELYMATSKNGKYTKVTTTSSKTIQYTKTKLTKNKTYYFKVRAYKTVNGKKYYSSYSNVKQVKIR